MFDNSMETATCICGHLLLRHDNPRRYQNQNFPIIITDHCLEAGCDCEAFVTPVPDRMTKTAYEDIKQ